MSKLMTGSVFAFALTLSISAHADTIAQWNFNDSNLTVDLGAGTAATVGSTTSTFFSGGGSSDPTQPGAGWSISAFAAQSTANKEKGASFTVSTLGLENISFTYDMRHSNTAAGHEVVQYSVDGTTFNDLATFATNYNGGAVTFINGRSVDLSAIAAADNQAALTFESLLPSLQKQRPTPHPTRGLRTEPPEPGASTWSR